MTKKELKEKKQIEKSAKEGQNKPSRAGKISTRGRIFQGVVIAKFQKRATIEFQRTIYIPKYERYLKKNTKIHARLPDEMAHDIHIGDLIQVQECRPLSKIIHFIVIKKIKGGDE
ncbi:MAG: 30S ribosomal protein S17 [archaeon]